VEFPSGVAAVEPPAGFTERLAGLGIELEPAELDRLGRYLGLLLAVNQTMNLTAVREPGEAWTRHVFDSLTLLGVLGEVEAADREAGLRVLDVGSGGGLPGIPLAVCMPGARFTLLDSTAKKCAFMAHAARELGLENVTVVHDRAETAGAFAGKKRAGSAFNGGGMRENFDVVTARAVGRLATLLELTVPFARVGGLCVLTKGQKAEEELAEAKRALHLLHAAHAGTVETPTGRVVVVEKLRKTPRDYPRGIGEAKRKPLGLEDHTGE